MKRIRTLATLVAASLVLAACGDVTPEPLALAMSDSEPTVVRLATPRISGFEDVVADWEREHPTARVEIVVRNIDDHHRSVLDNGGAGGPFDLVAFDASYGPEFRESAELFDDLETLDSTPRESDYLAARWAEGVADTGELIAVPLDVDSTALLVRSDLVDDATLGQLRSASSWCDILVAGDSFSDATNTAFLPDGDDLLRAILAQTRTSFVDEAGTLIAEDAAELERAWDLAMIALGEGPLHGEPCSDVDEVQRIARNIEFDTPQWQRELRDDDFAAVLAPWSFRKRISNAAPETAGRWATVSLPIDAPGLAGSSSEGGLHLAMLANSENHDLAYDLLLTLTSATIQEVAFADGSGPLPAAIGPHEDGTVARPADGFFVDSAVGSTYSDAANARPGELANPERRVVVQAMIAALNQVEGGGQTPDEAWSAMLTEVSRTLR